MQMKYHNKITFVKEYCLCRKIPYQFHGETLILGNHFTTFQTIYSVNNFDYKELIDVIDNFIEYNPVTGDFVRVTQHKI